MQNHVVLLCIALESRDLASAEHRLEGAPDDAHVDAYGCHLLAIHLDPELRLVELQVGVDVHQRWLVAQPAQNFLDVAVERLVGIGGLDDELDCLAGTPRAERGRVRCERANARDGHQLWDHGSRDLGCVALTLVPVHETRERHHVGDGGPSKNQLIRLDLGDREKDAIDLPRVLVHVVQGGAFRGRGECHDRTPILHGGELARQPLIERHGECRHREHGDDDRRAYGQRLLQ